MLHDTLYVYVTWLYINILNDTLTNYANFWQILKEPNKYDWSVCVSEQILMKPVPWKLEYSVVLKQLFLASCFGFLTSSCDSEINLPKYRSG